MDSDNTRRCRLCGSPLSSLNKGDQCFRHRVSTTDEEVIGPPEQVAATVIDLPNDPALVAVLKAVGEVVGCEPQEILQLTQLWCRELLEARNLTIYFLQEDFGRSLTEVARIFHRHQGRLGWVTPEIKREVETDPKLAEIVPRVRERMEALLESDTYPAEQEGQPVRRGTVRQIVAAASTVFKVSEADILGETRKSSVVRARHAVMYLLRMDLGMSLPEIGERLNRDHTSVLHGYRKVERKQRDPRVRSLLASVRKAYHS